MLALGTCRWADEPKAHTRAALLCILPLAFTHEAVAQGDEVIEAEPEDDGLGEGLDVRVDLPTNRAVTFFGWVT